MDELGSEEVEDMLAALTSVITVAVTATGGVLAVVLKARADRQAAVNPDWASFAESLQKQLDSQRDEIADLREEQRTIRSELRSLKRRYYTALEHLKDLRAAMTRARNPPLPLPVEIHDDLR